MTEFDPLDHARRKARKYEAEAIGLRATNDKLFRMLALMAQVAAFTSGKDPLDLVRAVEEVDRAA